MDKTDDKQEKVWDFYRRYAVGSKLCPSCLLCGKQVLDQAEWSIQHSELPDIYICKSCVDAARAVPSARGEGPITPEQFADVLKRIATRMGGHTIPVIHGPAWHNFMDLLRQVKPYECGIGPMPSEGNSPYVACQERKP